MSLCNSRSLLGGSGEPATASFPPTHSRLLPSNNLVASRLGHSSTLSKDPFWLIWLGCRMSDVLLQVPASYLASRDAGCASFAQALTFGDASHSCQGFSLGFNSSPYSHAVCAKSTSHIVQLPGGINHTFLGLLAKIKCSICSLEFDNSNRGHCPRCYLTYFSGGLLNSGACTAGLAAWPLYCTTALAEHPLQINSSFTFLFYRLYVSKPLIIKVLSCQHLQL